MKETNKCLDKPFNLIGQKVIITKGKFKGKYGRIIEESGYREGFGVVCRIWIGDNNSFMPYEFSHDFFEIYD